MGEKSKYTEEQIQEQLDLLFEDKELTIPLALLNKHCDFKNRLRLLNRANERKGYIENNPKHKERMREWIKEYNKRPEVKARKKEYYNRPEVTARREAYKKTERFKENYKRYQQLPETIANRRAYSQRPDIKAKKKEYYKRPEVVARRKETERRRKLKKLLKRLSLNK